MALDERLRTQAARQHSLLTIVQMRDLGASREAIRHRLRGPAWCLLTRRVVLLSGSPPTDLQRAEAAVLDAGPGAFLSHSSAAALWGLPGFDLRELHVTRSRGHSRAPCSLATAHEVLGLLAHHVTTLRDIRVSMPARMIFELAGSVHPFRAERACNCGWSRRLYCGQQLRVMLEEWAEHGRAGTTVMREILKERPPGWVPPASNLESRFEWILQKYGLPAMERQVDSGGRDWVGRVDFRDRRLPLVVEVLSELHHTALLDREADVARFADLTQAGFAVTTVWDREVWNRPAEVAQRICAQRRSLSRSCA